MVSSSHLFTTTYHRRNIVSPSALVFASFTLFALIASKSFASRVTSPLPVSCSFSLIAASTAQRGADTKTITSTTTTTTTTTTAVTTIVSGIVEGTLGRARSGAFSSRLDLFKFVRQSSKVAFVAPSRSSDRRHSRHLAPSYVGGSIGSSGVGRAGDISRTRRIGDVRCCGDLRRMSPQGDNSNNVIGNSPPSLSPVVMSSSLSPTSGQPQTTTHLSSKNDNLIAKRVPATLSSLRKCGERLRDGQLVSFPTETVYGLGCHALDPVAIQKVFDAKERPLSDPLIVHVANVNDALKLWHASSSSPPSSSSFDLSTYPTNELHQQQWLIQLEHRLLHTLATNFFPGPLTLVAKAHDDIPSMLMANTGYVACRCPSHDIARTLIDVAKVPIAAPSANKFGHVSPTRPEHVMNDLGMEDVWVIDPNLAKDEAKMENDIDVDCIEGGATNSKSVCQVGVESTVAKIQMMKSNDTHNNQILGRITILRHGAISSSHIAEILQKSNLSHYIGIGDAVQFTSEKVHNVAPGQTIKHYSPNVPCFLIHSSLQQATLLGEGGTPSLPDSNNDDNNYNNDENSNYDVILNNNKLRSPTNDERQLLSQSVIIDYGRRLHHYQPYALAYRDLSVDGDATMAASHVFATLRWSESVTGVKRVYVPDLALFDGDHDHSNGNDVHDKEKDNGSVDHAKNKALMLAIKDKLTRAASGVVIDSFR